MEKAREMSFKAEDVATNNFEVWNKALLSGDPKNVSTLYSESATFLPTMSPDFKIGKEEAEEYFKHFLSKNPNGKIIKEEIQEINEPALIHSGLYDFEVGPEDNRKTVNARFTYVLKKNKNGDTEILHHHSSVVPE